MYPWLTRLARVLTKALGVSVLVTGATLLVWLAASALSSPTASAQTVPPPAGGSSPSSPSTKHATKTKHSSGNSAKASAPSSTPASVREARARQAMDNEMYGDTKKPAVTKRAAAPTRPAAARRAPATTTPAYPAPSTKQLADAQKRLLAHDPEARQQIQESAQAKTAKAAVRVPPSKSVGGSALNGVAQVLAAHNPEARQAATDSSEKDGKSAIDGSVTSSTERTVRDPRTVKEKSAARAGSIGGTPGRHRAGGGQRAPRGARGVEGRHATNEPSRPGGTGRGGGRPGGRPGGGPGGGRSEGADREDGDGGDEKTKHRVLGPKASVGANADQGLEHSISGSHKLGSATVSGRAGYWAGSQEGAGASAGTTSDGVDIGAEATFKAGSGASASGEVKTKVGSVGGEGSVFTGSQDTVEARGHLGRDGVDVSGGGEASIGGEASVEGHEKVGPASVSEGGSVTYGVGGSFGGGADLSAHKIGFHVNIGATVGIGVKLNLDVSVDPSAVAHDVAKGVSSATHAVEHVGSEAVHGLEHVGSSLIHGVGSVASDAFGWL